MLITFGLPIAVHLITWKYTTEVQIRTHSYPLIADNREILWYILRERTCLFSSRHSRGLPTVRTEAFLVGLSSANVSLISVWIDSNIIRIEINYKTFLKTNRFLAFYEQNMRPNIFLSIVCLTFDKWLNRTIEL